MRQRRTFRKKNSEPTNTPSVECGCGSLLAQQTQIGSRNKPTRSGPFGIDFPARRNQWRSVPRGQGGVGEAKQVCRRQRQSTDHVAQHRRTAAARQQKPRGGDRGPICTLVLHRSKCSQNRLIDNCMHDSLHIHKRREWSRGDCAVRYGGPNTAAVTLRRVEHSWGRASCQSDTPKSHCSGALQWIDQPAKCEILSKRFDFF